MSVSPDNWPGPAGPSKENEVIVPTGPEPAKQPDPPSQPPAPQPEKAKAETKPDPKPAAPENPAQTAAAIEFFSKHPEVWQKVISAVGEKTGRDPLAEIDQLRIENAIERAARINGIPDEHLDLIRAGTPDEIERKAQHVASLLGSKAVTPASGEGTTTPEVVTKSQAPAPIPPPARPNLDPKTAKLEDLRAAAMAEPIVTQWGEEVKIRDAGGF